MAIHYSKYLNVKHRDLVDKGVYNGFVDKDSLLHIDPLLLKGCKIPEFQNSYNEFLAYFQKFIPLSKHVKVAKSSDRFFKMMIQLFTLREIPNTGLGYSKGRNHGSGISGMLANQLANSAYEIITAGLEDPEIFCLLPLIEDNIGADRISDMTISILQHNFLLYTQRVSMELNIATENYRLGDCKYNVPLYKGKPIHFVPMVLLSDLPIAHDIEDVDDVCDYNKALKRRVAEIIGLSWQECKDYKKSNWKSLILGREECYNSVISYFKKLYGVPYNFNADEKAQYVDIMIEEFLAQLLDKIPFNYSPQDTTNAEQYVYDFTKAFCLHFKRLVEDNRMSEIFYRKNRQPDETDWQLLLYTVASSYREAGHYDVAITREDNPGVGEIDFHVTKGYRANTIVEIKRSTNKDLYHGYREQLAAYIRAEKANSGIFMVIIEDDCIDKIKQQLSMIQNDMAQKGEYIPEVVYINGRKQPSASKPNYHDPHLQ